MKIMNLRLFRDVCEEHYTLGVLSLDGQRIGWTCEDTDMHLEDDLEHVADNKIYGKTAIPRGRYRVVMSYSPRFKRRLPELLDVPGFSNIRIHGGNDADDTLGCVLLGFTRTADGCANCAGAMSLLIGLIDQHDDTWLEIA